MKVCDDYVNDVNDYLNVLINVTLTPIIVLFNVLFEPREMYVKIFINQLITRKTLENELSQLQNNDLRVIGQGRTVRLEPLT